jgi:uncharacterized membrane protein YdjX (TVP38/TMEM64 family)
MTNISAKTVTAADRSEIAKVLSSPRFYATLIAIVLVTLAAVLPNFPISEADLTKIVSALCAYVIGVSIRPYS